MYKIITIIISILTLILLLIQPGKGGDTEQVWVTITAFLIGISVLRWLRITKNI